MYDLSQLPRSQLPQLKETLLSLIEAFKNGPKIVRTQLCVCLANLALQYPEWHNVVDSVLTAFGSDPQSLKCALEFLKILPEEVTDGKKATLSVRLNHTPADHHFNNLGGRLSDPSFPLSNSLRECTGRRDS